MNISSPQGRLFRADASKKPLFPDRSGNEQKEAKLPLLRRSEAQADGWCRENPKKCASRCRVSGLFEPFTAKPCCLSCSRRAAYR